MKKKYSSKLAWMGATLCAFLLVACGLKVADVTLSADEIEQGDEVTITSKLIRVGDGNNMDWGNNKGIYLLYAVRVPSDWTYAGKLEAYYTRNNPDDEQSNLDEEQNNTEVVGRFEFQESPAYAALAELSYPKEGYKWVGFQTTEPVDLNMEYQKDELFAVLKLKAGEATGEFHLDILSGCMSKNFDTVDSEGNTVAAPSRLLNTDGKVNFDLAFGRKEDGGVADKKKLSDGTEYIGFSEYLVNAATISPKERDDRAKELFDEEKGYIYSPYDLGGEEPTDDDLKDWQLTVTVKEKYTEPEPEVLPEISELISIDGGMIDGNFITCEDELAITFDIPEGYDIWYRTSTDGASVRRKVHGEEGEHDGFEKYEADQAIQLTGEHKLLECFVCNPETGNHSEVATYTLDIATGVFEIGMEWTNNAPVYNLKGQRVYDTTAPGIYVKNGKKFIVK